MSAAATRRTHVLIVAERTPTRAGLRLALEPDALCTEAGDAESAVAAAVRERPDVCLVALEAPGRGLSTLNAIVTQVPSTVAILLTDRIDEDEFMAALRVGASGYVPQTLDPARLPQVVRSVLRGEPAIPRQFVSRLVDELRGRARRRTILLSGNVTITLTAREWEVAERLIHGATTAEMAAELGLSPVTVRRHLGSVQRKLGVKTRADVVRLLTAEPGPSPA